MVLERWRTKRGCRQLLLSTCFLGLVVLYAAIFQTRVFRTSSYGRTQEVPNLVHYVVFGENREFTFLNYLSVLSVYKVQTPEAIMIHCDHPPVGYHWNRLVKEIPTLQVVKCEKPESINGRTFSVVFHASDVARIEILLKYGGIYIDYDVLLIQPLDNYFRYPCTMGKEKPPKFISGVIIAAKDSEFLKLWYEQYWYHYDNEKWDYNSAEVPYAIARKYPQLIHIEYWRFTTPDWTERDEFSKDNIEWRSLPLLHVMTHKGLGGLTFTSMTIRFMPGILGSVARNVYYGTPYKLRPLDWLGPTQSPRSFGTSPVVNVSAPARPPPAVPLGGQNKGLNNAKNNDKNNVANADGDLLDPKA